MSSSRGVLVAMFIFAIPLAGCATKNFGHPESLTAAALQKLSCPSIKRKLGELDVYEETVDEKAASGQLKQIFWGGMLSVIADNKLEATARRTIQRRRRLLLDAQREKKC